MSSSLIQTLLVLGVVGLAIIHRCDWFNICGGSISPSSPIISSSSMIQNKKEQQSTNTPVTISTTKSSGSCGTTIYKSTGRTANLDDTGPQGQAIHYASSGKAASSRRLNANNTPFSAIEATIYFQFNGTACGKPDPEMSIKLWGPTHSNNNCCWCIGVVTASGKVCFGGEGPHPSTTTCQQNLGNVGSLKGKTIGMKYIIWPGSSGGAHQELYLDTGNGQWRKMGQRDGPCGKDKKSTTVSKNQQVEFRIDCKNVTVQCASVNEIVPGGATATSNFAMFNRIAI